MLLAQAGCGLTLDVSPRRDADAGMLADATNDRQARDTGQRMDTAIDAGPDAPIEVDAEPTDAMQVDGSSSDADPPIDASIDGGTTGSDKCWRPSVTDSLVEVFPGDEPNLETVIGAATAGTTILFYGDHVFTDGVELKQPGVQVRGYAAGRVPPSIDASAMFGDAFRIDADDVLLADFELVGPGNGIVSTTSAAENRHGTRIIGVHIVNPRDFGIFVRASLSADGVTGYVNDGEIGCTTIDTTAEWRADTRCTPMRGIALESVSGWRVHENELRDLSCDVIPEGMSLQDGLRIYNGVRNVAVERNVFANLFSAARIGWEHNQQPFAEVSYVLPRLDPLYCGDPAGTEPAIPPDAVDVIVRNNFIASNIAADTGISVWQGCHVTVEHNSVFIPDRGLFRYSTIETRYANTYEVDIVRNVISMGINDRAACVAAGTCFFAQNVIETDASRFTSVDSADLHLVAPFAMPVNECTGEDIDGDARGFECQAGADEPVGR